MNDKNSADNFETRRREHEEAERNLELSRKEVELRRAQFQLDREMRQVDEEWGSRKGTEEERTAAERMERVGWISRSVAYFLAGVAALVAVVLVLDILYVIPDRIRADTTAATAEAKRDQATGLSSVDQQAAELLILELSAQPSSQPARVAILEALLGVLGSEIPAAARSQLRDIIETGGDTLTKIATAVKTFREAFQTGSTSSDAALPSTIHVSVSGACCCSRMNPGTTKRVDSSDPA